MLTTEAPPLPDTGDVKQGLVIAAGGILHYFKSMNGFAFVGGLIPQPGRNPEFLELFREHAIQPRRSLLWDLLDRAVQRGQLRADVDMEPALDCIAGSIFARYLGGLPMDQEWIDSVVRVLLEGFRR